MVRDDRPSFFDPAPQRVKDRIRRGATVGGPGLDAQHARPSSEHKVKLGYGALRIAEGQQRRAVDAIQVSEPPVGVQPAIERVEVRVKRVDVVAQVRLDADPQRRKQEDRFDSLGIHEGQPRLAFSELRADGLLDVGGRAIATPLAQLLSHGPRPRGPIEAKHPVEVAARFLADPNLLRALVDATHMHSPVAKTRF